MPFVSCSVSDCVYNCEHACGLRDLSVSGVNASRSSSTCCSSFRDQGCCEDPRPDDLSAVDCTAETCRHNKYGKCEAGAIDIGCPGAHCSDETECDTFRKK